MALLAYRFYRDPERQAPDRDDVIVSPADGVVIYVRKSEGGMLPVSDKHGRRYPLVELTKTQLHSDDAVVIGIAMNFADVHVNRSPLDGRVTFCRHFPGMFGSLRKPEMLFENERATTVIERDDLQVAVVQIASRLVRQIAVFLREGEPVALSQRLGVIRLRFPGRRRAAGRAATCGSRHGSASGSGPASPSSRVLEQTAARPGPRGL